MSFLDLPNELLFQISTHINRQHDFHALSLVCRQLHYKFFNDCLYIFNIKRRESRGLFWAAEQGSSVAVRRFLSLMDPDAAIDAEGPEVALNSRVFASQWSWWYPWTQNLVRTPLHFAIQGGHPDKVQLWWLHGAYPLHRNARGRAPLYMAVVSGNNEIIERICSYIDDDSLPRYLVDSEDEYTPLHIASRYGLSKWTRFFLEKGVDVDAKDKYGWTALRHLLAVQFRGIPIYANYRQAQQPSALQIFETIRVLIEFSADPRFEHESWGVPNTSERRYSLAADAGARSWDPKVRKLFRADADVDAAGASPSTSNEVGDSMKFTPYELR